MFNTSKIIRKLMIDRDISVTPLSRKIGIALLYRREKLHYCQYNIIYRYSIICYRFAYYTAYSILIRF